jgi:hypothetical protein
MVNQQALILANLSEQSIKAKLTALETAYHITEDSNTRQRMLLVIDDLKLELIKRGITWKI